MTAVSDGVRAVRERARAAHRAPVPAGPATRERAARVLEQALGAVWEGMLEARGLPAAPGWKVLVGEAWVVPAPAEEDEAG